MGHTIFIHFQTNQTRFPTMSPLSLHCNKLKRLCSNAYTHDHIEPYPICYIMLYVHYWLVVSTPLKNMSQLGLLSPIYGKIKIFQTTNQIINHEYTPPPQLSSSSNSICISKSWMIQENPLDEQPNRSKGLNYSGLYVRRWGSPIFCVWTNGLYIYIY